MTRRTQRERDLDLIADHGEFVCKEVGTWSVQVIPSKPRGHQTDLTRAVERTLNRLARERRRERKGEK